MNTSIGRIVLVATMGLATLLSGCGPDGGDQMIDSGPADARGSHAAPDAFAETGGVAVSAAQASFVGTWRHTSGTAVAHCGTDPEDVSPATGKVSISPGSLPDEILVDDDGCTLVYRISGSVAGASSGSTCGPLTVESPLLIVQPDGRLRDQSNGTATVQSEDCTVVYDAYLSREGGAP